MAIKINITLDRVLTNKLKSPLVCGRGVIIKALHFVALASNIHFHSGNNHFIAPAQK